MKNIALGRYIPLDSKIHRLDPRIKIVAMIVMMVAIFMVSNFWGYGFLFAILICVILISKLTFRFMIQAMKPMLFMLVFLCIINIFVIRTGYVLVQFWDFRIYSDAIFQTLFIVLRLMLMVIVTTLLMATTPPLDLTLAIEDLLKPLVRFHVPAHEIAMMISITLRFIPILIEDTQRIMDAQASRGVDFQEGNIMEKLGGIVSMIIPLFVSSFHRAEELADAMEARGYAPGRKRSRYKQLTIRTSDWAFLASTGITLALTIIIGRVV